MLGILLVDYLEWLALRPHVQYSLDLNGWAVDGFEVVVAVLCLTRALLRAPGRAAALALGAAFLSWGIGDTIWTAQTVGRPVPSNLSLVEALWLGFYPLACVGVVLFVRHESGRTDRLTLLDGAVAALGAAALCAAFAFQAVGHPMGGTHLSEAANIGFPIGDLLLFGVLVGAAALVCNWNAAPMILVAGAMVLNAACVTFTLVPSGLLNHRTVDIVHVLAWPAAGFLVSLAVWLPRRRFSILSTSRPPGYLLPGLASFSALTILLVGCLHHVNRVALGLAAATLVAVSVRLWTSVRSLRAQAHDRHHQAITDELTGLANRRHMFDILDAFFEDRDVKEAKDRRLAFLYVDLNDFKTINDSFGHVVGDELLRQLGPRLGALLGRSQVLVRLGGDELGVILPDASPAEAISVAQRITEAIAKPFLLDGMSVSIGASIGIASVPSDATDCVGLLRCADVSMYRAKMSQASFAVYDALLDGGNNQWRLVEELRHAMQTGGLELHYQPQLDLRNGEITGVEALIRWPHARLGFVPPTKFLPLAEEAGLMPALTSIVLDDALRQCAIWREAGHNHAVSVNVSPKNLLDPGLIDLVERLLARHTVPAKALVLEVTETTAIENFERVKLVIDGLRYLGILVSIDDFGAGFTSLAHLAGLAVEELKLDGSFITGLAKAKGERDVELVRAIIELGHSMGLRVVAEAIEDKATLQLLSDLGCDRGQGFFIGRPVPADELSLRAASVVPSIRPLRSDPVVPSELISL